MNLNPATSFTWDAECVTQWMPWEVHFIHKQTQNKTNLGAKKENKKNKKLFFWGKKE